MRILESLSKQFTICTICKPRELDRWIVSKMELFFDVTIMV